MSDKKRTELHEVGKFRLMEQLTTDIKPKNSSTKVGLGDDATTIAHGSKRVAVCTELLLEGINFDLTYFPLAHLGYKAAVMAFSNIYAMNATPTQLLMQMGISGRFGVEEIEALLSGTKLACERYGADLVNMGLSSSYTGLTISTTAIGAAKGSEIVSRTGAKPNDLICATGDFGAAYMGLQLLEREKIVTLSNPNVRPQFEGYHYLLERFLKPEARHDIIETLNKMGIKPTSMIDVSDGLSSDLLQICRSSNVGCRVYLDRIPVNPATAELAKEMSMDPHTAALNGGEDYELLFTVPLSYSDKVAGIEGLSVIGHITESADGAYLIPPIGDSIRITAPGWNAVESNG